MIVAIILAYSQKSINSPNIEALIEMNHVHYGLNYPKICQACVDLEGCTFKLYIINHLNKCNMCNIIKIINGKSFFFLFFFFLPEITIFGTV